MNAKEWADKFRELAKEMEQDIGVAKVTIEKVASCDYSDELLPISKDNYRVEFIFTFGPN